MVCSPLLDEDDPEYDCATDLSMSLGTLWGLDEVVTLPLDIVREGIPLGFSRGLVLSPLLSTCLLFWAR